MKKPKPESEVISVFYNSACPVCNAGINEQKKRFNTAGVNVRKVQWNDVHTNNKVISQLNDDVDLSFIRERLHVIDTTGEVQVGIDAFITLWNISPSEKWKANILQKPVIHSLAITFYNIFASLLFRWNRLRGNW